MVSHGDIEGGMVIKDGKILTSTDRIEKDDKGQFRLEVGPENFSKGTEFMLNAQFSAHSILEPEPSVPLFDKEGNLIMFDSTMLIGTLKVGDVTAK